MARKKKTESEKFTKRYLGKKFPFHKYKFEVLLGTNNVYSLCYLKELNLTCQILKESDVVLHIYKGRQEEKKNEQNDFLNFTKIKDYRKWYQKLHVLIFSNIVFCISYIILTPVITFLFFKSLFAKKA